MKLNGPLDTAISAAASVFGGRGGSSPTGGSSMPGVTVSPAFQQAFTPQFAPTMQQQQDSPGGVQTAVPYQLATGGQTARTGDPSMPGMPSMPYIPPAAPALPSLRPGDIPSFQQSDKYTGLIQTGIWAAAILAGISMWQKNKKRTPVKRRTKSTKNRKSKK